VASGSIPPAKNSGAVSKFHLSYRNMSENKLKTAVLGLDNNGQLLLEAASQLDYQIRVFSEFQ